ncbi:MAG TPA: MarC family protein [Gemmatimonadales bacterium]|jgi:multiple antibiotic resistance protein|nr:MarC family protein [Gemmatimonadales bacterium]
MTDLAQFALVTTTSVLFIVDPVAVIPTYLVITQDETPQQRRRTARRACIAMTILLVVFAATGTALFRTFGITLAAFRTAGGLILWFVALDMLQGERRTQEGRTEVLEGQVKDDVAITPLAIPMLAGPGAISTVIVLSSQARGPTQTAIVYGAIVLTGLISFIALRVGEPLLTRLGKTGVRVVTRIMGLLLAAVAVQFVLSGVKEALVAK